MTDHFTPAFSDEQLRAMGVLGFAHVGDAVYELLVRTWLCQAGRTTAATLHRETVRRVCAPAQARAMEKLLPALTEEEHAVYKRGRNAKVNSVPKNAALADYHAATGLETLFGWLWLRGEKNRISELFELIVSEEN